MALKTQNKSEVSPGDISGNTDYDRMARAIRYITAHAFEQPKLDDIARAAGLSPYHFQRLFSRWAGVSPKRLMGYLTLVHARERLRAQDSVLDAALDAGLSGPSRLHDLFVTYDALTPGQYKQAGEGLELAFGFHDSPFGICLIVKSMQGITGIAFADDTYDSRAHALADMQSRWPNATLRSEPGMTKAAAAALFAVGDARNPLSLHVMGTNFQIKVWEALLRIPEGEVVTYAGVARAIGTPKAARAVGTAVGRNPLSFIIPCHRVLREGGALGGYHWGIARKQAMLAWEAARADGVDQGNNQFADQPADSSTRLDATLPSDSMV